MKDSFYENNNLTRILDELKGYYICDVSGITNGERNENFMQGTEIKFIKVVGNGHIEKKVQIFENGKIFEAVAKVRETHE